MFAVKQVCLHVVHITTNATMSTCGVHEDTWEDDICQVIQTNSTPGGCMEAIDFMEISCVCSVSNGSHIMPVGS